MKEVKAQACRGPALFPMNNYSFEPLFQNLEFDFMNSPKEEKSKYKDVKFMTAQEKEKAYKCFSKVLKARSLSLMDKNLYKHLHLHCGFIAHYDIHGFRAEYSDQRFRYFIEHFDRNHKYFNCLFWINQFDYADINNDMVDLATQLAPIIYAELDAQRKVSDIAMARTLAAQYGLKVVAG